MKSQINDDEPRHRRKSRTASKSNSGKRADHKHQYEKIILKWIFGFRWSRRCSVCGRIDDSLGGFSASLYQDFLKPEAKNSRGISSRDYLNIPEIRAKFPGVDIYKIDDRVLHGGWKYILVKDEEDKT